MNPIDKPAKKRALVVEWLNSLFPGINIPLEASEEELRLQLFDGTILCGIVCWQDPSSMMNQRGAYMSSEQRREKIRRFLSAIERMGLPRFSEADLENGSISVVVDCLLFLRDHLKSKPSESNVEWITNCGNQPRKKWMTLEDDKNASQGNFTQSEKSSLGREKEKNISELRLQYDLCSPIMSEQSVSSICHTGHKFHEVFQLKQGCFADIPTAKISEIMKSNGLDNAPTQSLISVIYGILDESIERKNGEIPFRVASLLRRVVQEIERRISSQTEHIRNKNNFIKAREEKYQTRIRMLETLASGTNEETQTASNQVQVTKAQNIKAEENKEQEEQHALKLMEEKKNSDRILVELKQELKTTKNTYENHCQQLEVEAKQNEARLQKRIKEVELLLSESSIRRNELDALSDSKFQNLNQKENVLHNFISFQLQSVKDLRTLSEYIRIEVINSQKKWKEEMNIMGIRFKVLVDAAENYHTILAENRKLHNEVQELKGNIRVCCRVRPFLPGHNAKSSTIDYIGEHGELVLLNPSRQGKVGHRMFKFNKVFGPNATQAQVFLNIQPLIRSVLDGYNVCIFAYGQTGSGKTYTMSGPNSPSQEEWGVNYRALNDLFGISQVRQNAFTYEVTVQMVEIYNEQVRDLLSNSASQKRLGICSSQPNGLAVPDASMIPVKSTSDVLELIQFGQKNRAVSSTALNERSSRSHSILTIHVRGVDVKTGSTSRGCLHLIDLAGSERVDRSEVKGDRLKEAQHINKSLSALGDVIFALSQKSAHVPYRNSKLTQVLHSSLGGQAKTLMLVQVNPDLESYSESLSTLKFAERVSGVELGAAKSNKEGKDVKDLIEQVASLKNTIARKDEEIEQLQTLKDLRAQSPKSNFFRQSSSFSGLTQQGGGKVMKQTEKDALDPESNEKNLDTGILSSMLDDGGNAGESCDTNDKTEGCDDGASDGRLSDISCGDISVGEEIEYSMSGAIESAQAGKSTQVGTDMLPKTPRVPKPLSQRTGQALSIQAKSSDSSKAQVTKKSTSSELVSSSVKQLKR